MLRLVSCSQWCVLLGSEYWEFPVTEQNERSFGHHEMEYVDNVLAFRLGNFLLWKKSSKKNGIKLICLSFFKLPLLILIVIFS